MLYSSRVSIEIQITAAGKINNIYESSPPTHMKIQNKATDTSMLGKVHHRNSRAGRVVHRQAKHLDFKREFATSKYLYIVSSCIRLTSVHSS